MKNKMLVLYIFFSLSSCSNKNDFDNVVAAQYQQCGNNTTCLIDFSSLMWFEWDTICFYSGANSLEEIEKDLGFTYNQWGDVGDRVIFFNKNTIVYQKEWFPTVDEPLKRTVFVTNLNKMKLPKSDTKFKIRIEGEAFYLEKY